MKNITIFILLSFLTINPLLCQPERIGAGLSFSNKRTLFFSNNQTTGQGETGNPGVVIKTYIPVNKMLTMHVIPSVTAYNPLIRRSDQGYYTTTTYMFSGDLEVQYQIFHDKTLKLVAFTGGNYTWIFTNNKQIPDYQGPQKVPDNDELKGFGPSLGASLEMRMSPFIDFILSGRYTYSFLKSANPETMFEPMSVPVIQVMAVYYFHSRGKGFYRK